MDKTSACVKAYEKHKNLKIAANDVGIPWQTVYVHLRRAGVSVTGDKIRYGSDSDKLAAKAEETFEGLVPAAVNQNKLRWQSKVDFVIGDVTADIKASRLHQSNKRFDSKRWAFSVKKQEMLADFFVCAAFACDSEEIVKWLVIPSECARFYQTINLPENGGKWSEYEVPEDCLLDFFAGLSKQPF